MAHKVTLTLFTNCCGIYNLNHFFQNKPYLWQQNGTDFHPYAGYFSQKDVDEKYNIPQGLTEDTEDKWVSRVKKEIQQWIDAYKNKKSYFLAAMNSEESKVLEKTLLDLGFEILVPETKNPTGTAITLYIYHLLPRDSKPVKSILSYGSDARKVRER